MKNWWLTTILWLGVAVLLLPLLFVLLTSLAPPDFRPAVSWLPSRLTIANYTKAWNQANFILAFVNSTIVAVATTVLQVLTSLLAAYALSRLQFYGKNFVLFAVIATLVIPFQLLALPIFLILRLGNLINTYAALILPTAASGFGIFWLRQYMETIPIALEEAAMLDGANRWQILWYIIFPLTRPAIVTLGLFAFIGEWNDLFKPLLFTTKPSLQTVQQVLAGFQELYTADWSLLMAAVVIATLPVLVLFWLGQQQILRGVAATGLKN
ncbi:MAG: carbohydrate ABC transporter permease [Pseudanabaenaceae cyanobacterium SKYGB_i_bin29]|nr:carbohydrate ABC transporter permease [Pseudanabaenaceae cyanobacterium SKYG29]MDW8420925.1 carbohydrate ABC transporter permease [Pseudanabaenaceae cyanobacterium SKYGB_i_bin29]